MELAFHYSSTSDKMAVFQSDIATTAAPVSDDNFNPASMTAAVFLIVICIVGIVGNILVIIAVQLTRRLQTSTNVFVVVLSCTDLLTALTLPFQASALFMTLDARPAFAIVCEVIGALSFIFNGWSIITLIAIAFNRYILITQTSQTYRRILRKRNIIIILVFTLSYPTFFVILFGATGWAVFGERNKTCGVADGRAFNILSGASMVTLMAAILYFYLRIYLHVRNHVRRVHTEDQVPQPSSSTQQSSGGCQPIQEDSKKKAIKKDYRKSTEAKITKNMLFVVLCFFICMLPITVYLFADDIEETVVAFCVVVLSLNCCLNPVIYAWKHPIFRHVFTCIFTCRLRDIEDPSRWLREYLSNTSSKA